MRTLTLTTSPSAADADDDDEDTPAASLSYPLLLLWGCSWVVGWWYTRSSLFPNDHDHDHDHGHVHVTLFLLATNKSSSFITAVW